MEQLTKIKRKRTIVFIVIAILAVPLIVCSYLGYSYFKYSAVTKLSCKNFDWWEDKAECAANLSLRENNPRYCRIDLFGEVGDLCATLYAKQTMDPTTCPAIDNILAEQQCKERFDSK